MQDGSGENPPVRLFISYSHKDEDLRRNLEDHLVVLQRAGLISVWNDRGIGPGEDWQTEIDTELNRAAIVLMLVSPSFLASDYCWTNEMNRALDRHRAGEAIVIPVIMRPCLWSDTPLAHLQALPRDARPVTEWESADAALYDVVAGIRDAILALRARTEADRERAAAATREAAQEADRKPAEAESHARAPKDETPPETEARPKSGEESESAGTQAPPERGAPGRERGPRSRRPLWIAGAAAVLLVTGVGLAWNALRSDRQDAGPAIVQREPVTSEPSAAAPAAARSEQQRQRNAAEPQTARGAPLETFRDCPACPEMVALPGGTFLMGSPPGEQGRDADEGPQHAVTVAPFAIGRSEVTFDEWHACVEDGGCNGYRPGDEGWGGGHRPVVNVSWQDAQAYAAWLADTTGKPYRLPTEAEWEYAARAGTSTRFSFGDEVTEDQANFGLNVGQTTEAGRYAANPWGLYDMHGNVWEWVEDVWHDDYRGAPEDGSAWTEGGNPGLRVLRGGSWDVVSWDLRSASRDEGAPGIRFYFIGFRVARDL